MRKRILYQSQFLYHFTMKNIVNYKLNNNNMNATSIIKFYVLLLKFNFIHSSPWIKRKEISDYSPDN